MKKINKKKVVFIIILIIIIIYEILAFQNSRAKKMIEINTVVKDYSSLLKDENFILEALDDGNNGYYVILPEFINEKKISKYYITQKELESENQNNTINNTTNEIGNENSKQNQVEKKVGDKFYLTQQEVAEKQTKITVEYDKKEKNSQFLYSKSLEKNVNNNIIKIEGYMPQDSKIKAEIANQEQVEEVTKEYLNDRTTLKIAYDIKIISEDKEYEPIDFDENVKITISGLEKQVEENKIYKIIHINNENKVEEIKNVNIKENELIFPAKEFSTYALLEENTANVTNNDLQANPEEIPSITYETRSAIISTQSSWNGNVATKFTWGNGTQDAPYLIADGEDLAYLANQVNNGEMYEGKYFQLASDIDLGNKIWTPIGNTNNSFRGILDGAGHAIANAKIQINNLPSNTYDSYGIFGSIGGGNSKTIIRNIEFSGIDIDISASGATGSWYGQDAEGMHIGCVVGTLYKNSNISNLIVKSSNITDSNTIEVYDSEFQFAVGGIVGYVTNAPNNDTDPGVESRYLIDNCFSNVMIDLNATAEFTTGWFSRNGRSQYHTGGIVGTIRSQPIWPINCLYSGTISSNGFIGPIFAALVNNTDVSSYNNFDIIWNGNDAGDLSVNNAYYTGFAASGTTFTQTVNSGNSTARKSTSTSNVGYIQGVNKGIYTNNMADILSMFNGNVSSTNGYVGWFYENNTFSFKERLITTVQETIAYTYEIQIDDPYNVGEYIFRWYRDNELDTSIQGTTYTWIPNYEKDENIMVVTSDGSYFAVTKFIIKKIGVDIVFNIQQSSNSVTATLEGEGLRYTTVDDYTFQWYQEDISGEIKLIEGATSLKLTNLEEGMDYKLIATNKKIPQLSTQNQFTYGDRIVVYVNYDNGNDNNDGYTPDKPVSTISKAYEKLDSNGSRNKNVIVIIGTYSSTSFMNSATNTTYQKNVTITGKYKGTDYNGQLYFYSGTSSYRYLTGDTTFQHLTFYGGRNQMYFYLQGHSLTMGEGIVMSNYATANSNQGLLGDNAPAFHIICGWLRYNYSKLPRNDTKVLIKSGTYGRIIGGGSPGTTGASNLQQTTSYNFMGSSMEDSFKIDITIDIKNSTTASTYDYDVNLLVGGSACGNNYSRVTENIKSGTVGRVLGGSIGDSSDRPNNWNYPINTFLGETTINITGGKIAELYGGCLGRNMNALSGSSSIICDSYFYGKVTINMSAGEITRNIYGAGAGGVTGYSINSSDNYKSYGEVFNTSVNINLSGGIVSGNIYGGGYGYTEYLTENVTAKDSGSLYGKSNIIITGSPTIQGDIYAAGCGYNLSSKPYLAQFEGSTNIDISGSPQINGQIFGAGAGITGYENMAKLTGTSNIKIASDIHTNVYGGGNIAQIEGATNINIQNGNHTSNIYGGGNIGTINGNTNININGGTLKTVYGGGNQADVTSSTVNINGGTTNEIYAGGNSSSVNKTNTYLNGGNATIIYGGSNQTGIVQNSYIQTMLGSVGTIYGGNNVGGTTNESSININGGSITTAIYGGGNQVDTTKSKVVLQKSINSIPNVYGGGNQAGVPDTYIYCDGANADNIFGGSNANGTVNQSNVNVNSGTLGNIYGGNNQGGTTKNTNISINGANIQNVYGGGDRALTDISKVDINSGSVQNMYGGGNQAGVGTSYVETKGGIITNIYGGSNISGDVNESNVHTSNSSTTSNLLIQSVYGGNNQGGETNTANVTIDGEGVTDVYGGGNQAITNVTNLNINGKVNGKVFGGGNKSGIKTNTNVNINEATINDNVYGGGDEGVVEGSTYVNVKNSILKNNLYAGGNGATAIVHGNTNLVMEGTKNNITNSVFGGGNKAATGQETMKNSISTVNIAGGIIGKNVYGGANTSVVYGTTQTNIGYDSIGNASLEKGNIEIKGTVFGGGEANEAGDENYDFSFISVTNGIDININGKGHNNFAIKGSIFGSGNASSTSGESYINIQNYGTTENPQSNISIQRANCATISNSAISLSGATDRTNEYSSTYFSLSRVNEVKLKNNTTLYLANGANLLKKLNSVVEENGIEVKGEVTINPSTGETTKNVDNRIYMLEGKNLNIATNEQVTAYGQVSGMIFFGLFTNKMNPATSTGFYHQGYRNGDTIVNTGTFSSNSYAMAEHMPNHDTTKDGFYSNYNQNGVIKTNYIETTPQDDVYYMWLVGEKMDVTTFEISLTASKYATLGTYELSLTGFSNPNIKFNINGFSAGLASGISLVDPSGIEAIAPNSDIANTVYGLTMKSGNNGWQTKGSTTFLTQNGGTYTGNKDYNADNSNFTPTLNFCFYHSENINVEQNLGDVKVRLQVLTPIDDLNYSVSYIDINVTLLTALYQNDFYEAAITPGEQFGLFTTTETNITNKSAFSTYYSLYVEDFSNSKYYKDYKNYKRALVSRDSNNMPYVFPENTKLTMLDMVTNKYYYYTVTKQDVLDGKYIYLLSDFTAMGSNNQKFDEVSATDNYYDKEKNLIYENFIFHIKFIESQLNSDITNNTLLMELRDGENQTLVGVLGIQRGTMLYSVFNNKNSTINVTADVTPKTIYLGNSFNLDVTTDFKQVILNSKTIYDTQYFDKKMGIKLTFYDSNGNKLNSDSLLGIKFMLDGKLYYPRFDGTTRINIADKVSNILSRIKVITSSNKILATGEYRIKIESFGSSDGIYYGLESSDQTELTITIINSAFGLKVSTDDKSKIIEKETGNTLNGNNSLISQLEYKSGFNNPNIAISLYRRDYSNIYSQDYTLVDLKDYVTNTLTQTKREKEYVAYTKPSDKMTHFLSMKSNLVTGTYKLVYKLYDGNNYIGETYEYFVIK